MHYPGAPPKPIAPIKKVSEKRALINRKEYEPAKKEVKKEKGNVCLVNSPVCIKEPVRIHHLKGKSSRELLSDKKYMLPCCDPCNGYIESHTAWAKQNGFKLSKHTA